MKKTLMLALMFLLSGCSTTLKTYYGPVQPESDLAVLHFSGGFWSDNFIKLVTFLETIDGRSLNAPEWREPYEYATVLPGEHLLVFNCRLDGERAVGIIHSGSYSSVIVRRNHYEYPNSMVIAKVNLLPGHHYQVRYHLYQYWLKVKSFDITDLTTGEIVFEKYISSESDGD